MQGLRRSLFLITLPLVTFGCLASIDTAKGQIIPDNSLGAEKSVVNSNANTDRINGGARRGANLFHSFQEFNVGKEGKAYFSNPAGIENIFSRVTGSKPSNILGTLGVANGNANLFFINPNGVFFGPDARLDLRGSFLASTANSLLFDGGLEFSTSNPQAPPMLTVNIPIGLQFRENPGGIINQSVARDVNNNFVGLQVDSGQSLSLVGGDVNLEGGKLTAGGGRVELGGLAQPGTVSLKSDRSLSFPDGVARGNVSLTNGATVVSLIGQNMKENGADVIINARSLSMLSNAVLSTSTLGQGNSGNIQINATDSVTVTSGSQLRAITAGSGNAGNIVIQAKNATVSFNGMETIASTTAYGEIPILNLVGTGQGGDITINAHTLSVTNGATLATSTLGQGNSGNIQINIADSISVTSGSKLGAFTGGSGNAGNIVIQAKDATVSFDGMETAATTSVSGKVETQGVELVGRGQGGDIKINARTLSLTNGAKLFTDTFGQGNAGKIDVQARLLHMSDGAALSSSTSGTGDAGKVFVQAKDSVSLDNSKISSQANIGAVGNGGDVNITTGSLSLNEGANLEASTYGTGDAGNIFVQAKDSVSLDNSKISSQANIGAIGNGGDISINARSLNMRNGSYIQTSTSATQDTTGKPSQAGTVTLHVDDALNLDSSDIHSNLESGAVGQGGKIKIEAGSVSLHNGAQIQTLVRQAKGNQPAARGNAGSITIQANDVILEGVSNTDLAPTKEIFPSSIRSEVQSNAQGNAGSIQIDAKTLTIQDRAQLTSNVESNAQGNAGSIKIKARSLTMNEGDLTTSTSATQDTTGKPSSGGTILLQVDDAIKLDNSSYIFNNVESGGVGKGGEIKIKTGLLSLLNGSQIQTLVRGAYENQLAGKGNAGNISIQANDVILEGVSNTNLAPTKEIFSSGIFSNNEGDGAAGNIKVTTTKDIQLDNEALINANTQGGQGNITLNSRDLILRRNSKITTNASGPATGGNITINTGNLVALEDSNITANAQKGFGGKVRINAQGRRFRSKDSDITASSELGPEFSGEVKLNLSNVDPSHGLVELPKNVVDPTEQIAQNPCQRGVASKFIITGRGGLPPSPNEATSSDTVRVDLVEPATEGSEGAGEQRRRGAEEKGKSSVAKSIVPAQGWIFDKNGEVMLTGYDPTGTGSQRLLNSDGCPAP